VLLNSISHPIVIPSLFRCPIDFGIPREYGGKQRKGKCWQKKLFLSPFTLGICRG
jgi:hypothetical protein